MLEDDRNTAFYELLSAYDRTLRCGDLMWQHHFELLLLGYGAYVTFSDFCKSQPAGHPRPAHRADGRRDRRAPVQAEHRASPPGEDRDRQRRGRGVRRGALAGGDRRRARAERRGQGLARGAREDQGPVVQHGHRRRALPLLRQLVRRPDDRLRLDRRPRARAERGRGGRAPERGARARARAAGGGVRRAARRGDARDVQGAARPLADGLPVRRGAQVLLRLLVPDPLVEQGARVRRAAREARLPRGHRGRLPARPPRGRAGARRAAPDLGDRRRAARPDALAADRRAAQGAAREARRLDAAACDRRDARGDHRSDEHHALGRHDAARPGVGAAPRRAEGA